MLRTVILLLLLNSAVVAASQSVCISEEEKKLYEILMDYRKQKGLPEVKLSPKLIKTAQAHAGDLQDHYTLDQKCNPHSWSDNGPWKGCCYTGKIEDAGCMWEKPGEIAGYEEKGYEIAYWHSAKATADEALAGWKKSPAHNPVIINEGMWNQVEWEAVGIGISQNYAVVWFGTLEDAGFVLPCD